MFGHVYLILGAFLWEDPDQAVVSLMEELSDDSILQEARSCEDEEFLLFLLIRERQSHIRIENYFERIRPLYSVSDFLSHFRMSRTTISCLEQFLATCLSLPQDKGMGETYHLTYRSKYLLRYGYLGTLNACDQWPIDLTLQNRFYFVFIAEFVEDCQQSFRSIYEVPTSLKLSTTGQND